SFCHQLPFDRSSLTHWRQRLGEEQLVALLQESLSVAHKTGALAVLAETRPDSRCWLFDRAEPVIHSQAAISFSNERIQGGSTCMRKGFPWGSVRAGAGRTCWSHRDQAPDLWLVKPFSNPCPALFGAGSHRGVRPRLPILLQSATQPCRNSLGQPRWCCPAPLGAV